MGVGLGLGLGLGLGEWLRREWIWGREWLRREWIWGRGRGRDRWIWSRGRGRDRWNRPGKFLGRCWTRGRIDRGCIGWEFWDRGRNRGRNIGRGFGRGSSGTRGRNIGRGPGRGNGWGVSFRERLRARGRWSRGRIGRAAAAVGISGAGFRHVCRCGASWEIIGYWNIRRNRAGVNWRRRDGRRDGRRRDGGGGGGYELE